MSARLGAWGPGRATGVPSGCPRTVRAAGWAPFAESPAPVAACLRAPGRGRLGGGRERNCTAAQVESRAASRYPGSRESWHSGEDSLHLQPRRGLLALPGVRSLPPPPGVPRPWGARDHPEPSGSPAWDLAVTQLPLGPRQLPESRAPAEAGADSAGQSGFTGCPSVPGLARRGVNFFRLGLRAPRQQQVVLGTASGPGRAEDASPRRDGVLNVERGLLFAI